MPHSPHDHVQPQPGAEHAQPELEEDTDTSEPIFGLLQDHLAKQKDKSSQFKTSLEHDIPTIVSKAVENSLLSLVPKLIQDTCDNLSRQFVSERATIVNEAAGVFDAKLDLVVEKNNALATTLEEHSTAQSKTIKDINAILGRISKELKMINTSTERIPPHNKPLDMGMELRSTPPSPSPPLQSRQPPHQSPLHPTPSEASLGPHSSRKSPRPILPSPKPAVNRPILPTSKPAVNLPQLITKRRSDSVSTESPQLGPVKRRKNTDTADQSSLIAGTWKDIDVGIRHTVAGKRAAPIEMKQSGLPIDIQGFINSRDRSNANANHRKDSKSQNKKEPTICWMTANNPIHGFPIDAPTVRSECAMCRRRRNLGDPSACFYFTSASRISWFRLESGQELA